MKPKKPNSRQSLAESNPELAKQWHQGKNENLAPFDINCEILIVENKTHQENRKLKFKVQLAL